MYTLNHHVDQRISTLCALHVLCMFIMLCLIMSYHVCVSFCVCLLCLLGFLYHVLSCCIILCLFVGTFGTLSQKRRSIFVASRARRWSFGHRALGARLGPQGMSPTKRSIASPTRTALEDMAHTAHTKYQISFRRQSVFKKKCN